MNGDPRRCNLHPGQVTSSPDGMFDTPCPVCEWEGDQVEEGQADAYGECDFCGQAAAGTVNLGDESGDRPCCDACRRHLGANDDHVLAYLYWQAEQELEQERIPF
jgi:hypothetical protein